MNFFIFVNKQTIICPNGPSFLILSNCSYISRNVNLPKNNYSSILSNSQNNIDNIEALKNGY